MRAEINEDILAFVRCRDAGKVEAGVALVFVEWFLLL